MNSKRKRKKTEIKLKTTKLRTKNAGLIIT